MEKFDRHETYTDANLIILITALVTSSQNETFYATLPIRISLVYTDIVMLQYNFKSLLEKKKKKKEGKSEIRQYDFKIARIVLLPLSKI